MFFAGYLLLSYVAFDVVLYLIIFIDPVWELIHRSGANQATVASVVFSVFILAVFLVYFRFVFGFFMRNFERQADGYVYTLFDSARPLIATFHKIAFTSGQSADRPNWHHYSIRERIDHLARCELDRGLAAAPRPQGPPRDRPLPGRHGARRGGRLPAEHGHGRLAPERAPDRSTVIERQLEKAPDNPALYALMGDLGFRRKDYAAVQQAYERALALKPDSPSVLNNLAWLYATCEDERFRDPPAGAPAGAGGRAPAAGAPRPGHAGGGLFREREIRGGGGGRQPGAVAAASRATAATTRPSSQKFKDGAQEGFRGLTPKS